MLYGFFCIVLLLAGSVYSHENINHRFADNNLIDTESISNHYETRCIYEEGTGRLLAKLFYQDGVISLRYFRQYDDYGYLCRTLIDNGNSVDSEDLTGVTDRWVTAFIFDPANPSRDAPIKISETHINCLSGEEEILWQTGEPLPQEDSKIFPDINDPIKFFDDNLSYASETLLGKTIFQISGYYFHPPRFGTYGDGEISDKVRVTLINGILNFPVDHKDNLEMFTSMHHKVNIHYIFRSCEGWSRDMVRCLISKMGFITEQSLMLALTWKTLIAEMEGPEGGGTIIHYAHSIGGSETYIAKNLLSPEEQKMITVYTFGSPTLIPDGGFKKVVNFVSKRDGVCLTDPIRYINGLLDPDSNIIYIDTYLGMPFVDHTLTQPSYNAVLQKLGEEFVEKYVNKE